MKWAIKVLAATKNSTVVWKHVILSFRQNADNPPASICCLTALELSLKLFASRLKWEPPLIAWTKLKKKSGSRRSVSAIYCCSFWRVEWTPELMKTKIAEKPCLLSISYVMLTILLRMLFCFTFLTFCSIEVIISTLTANAGDAMERMRERYGVSATYLLNVFIYWYCQRGAITKSNHSQPAIIFR